ncbi:hypothetical protein [Streptomyces flavofungini]|uniref:hypothetical protein n=1 Tax=Streptomyces flavofungini TaxID=68200 RepID=UPI0025B0017E|nr:hypothetical protein [Streptomyces flavofungini]WJV48975.1 hypothetical protein QUY26_27745 [Streptomyces flavofungini]
MGRTVEVRGLPRLLEDDAAGQQSAPQSDHRLSLTVEAGRSSRDLALLADVAVAALARAGASRWLLKRTEDTVRIAAHYLVGHSSTPRISLTVTADGTTVTLAVTDYSAPVWFGPPAWLPVTADNTLHLHGVRPGVDPLTADPHADGLQLHRTPDGHIRLGTHAPWEQAMPRRQHRDSSLPQPRAATP